MIAPKEQHLSYDKVLSAARAVHLEISGAFHPSPDQADPNQAGPDKAEPDQTCPDGTKTLLLLSPQEPQFWPAFTASPEYLDGAPEPMDRWSTRVIGQLAQDFGGQALFPFGGPPYLPFLQWAEASGRAWVSAIGLLIHDRAGLFISYRGALALPVHLALPPQTGVSPCVSCADQPCLSACPVGAMGPKGYDVPSCRAYIAGNSGRDCIDRGCAVRRACPVSVGYGRLPAQSAFHMKAFQ